MSVPINWFGVCQSQSNSVEPMNRGQAEHYFLMNELPYEKVMSIVLDSVNKEYRELLKDLSSDKRNREYAEERIPIVKYCFKHGLKAFEDPENLFPDVDLEDMLYDTFYNNLITIIIEEEPLFTKKLEANLKKFADVIHIAKHSSYNFESLLKQKGVTFSDLAVDAVASILDWYEINECDHFRGLVKYFDIEVTDDQIIGKPKTLTED